MSEKKKYLYYVIAGFFFVLVLVCLIVSFFELGYPYWKTSSLAGFICAVFWLVLALEERLSILEKKVERNKDLA